MNLAVFLFLLVTGGTLGWRSRNHRLHEIAMGYTITHYLHISGPAWQGPRAFLHRSHRNEATCTSEHEGHEVVSQALLGQFPLCQIHHITIHTSETA